MGYSVHGSHLLRCLTVGPNSSTPNPVSPNNFPADSTGPAASGTDSGVAMRNRVSVIRGLTSVLAR